MDGHLSPGRSLWLQMHAVRWQQGGLPMAHTHTHERPQTMPAPAWCVDNSKEGVRHGPGQEASLPEQGFPSPKPHVATEDIAAPGVVLRAPVNNRDEYLQRLESPALLAWRHPSLRAASRASGHLCPGKRVRAAAREVALMISGNEGPGGQQAEGDLAQSLCWDGAPHFTVPPTVHTSPRETSKNIRSEDSWGPTSGH